MQRDPLLAAKLDVPPIRPAPDRVAERFGGILKTDLEEKV